ncbi:hypothetical protein [Dactylosporangium sp. CS-033363]|uniref:hypothetical protein n=1 Tax=Dactylosporangium sp. CS-033363 TaxID=3239935 RepID=UPI003D8FE7C9
MSRGHGGYTRILRVYPRDYPRDELLGTLLAAAPGRTGPTAREAANLLRHGLRARLGRPGSRTVVFWALATALIGGLFGAAFAARAGWETVAPLPGPAQTRAMAVVAAPGARWGDASRPPAAAFLIYGSPLSVHSLRDLLLGDGGEYTQATTGTWAPGPGADPAGALAAASDNLEAAGWTVYPAFDDGAGGGTLVARRGSLVLTLEAYGQSTADTTFLSAGFQRTTPAAVWPCGIAGGLLAGLAAFLVFGWASRRTDAEEHPARGSVKACFGLALFLWWAPTLFAFPLMVEHHLEMPHPSWHPMWEWFGQPTFSLFFVVGGGLGLLALALAALPRRYPRAATRPAEA